MARAKNAKKHRQDEPLGAIATQAHQQGDYAKAESLYRALLKEHPENHGLLAAIGQVCLDQNRFEEAIAFLEKSLKIKGADARVIYNLGLSHQKINNHGQAIHFYEQALAREPNLVSAHINLAAIYYLQKSYLKAIDHLETAINLEPNAARAHANLAVIYAETGQVSKALPILEKALSLDSTLSAAHSNYLLDLHYDPNQDANSIFQAHLQWAETHAKPLSHRVYQHQKLHASGKRLRIGYVSPDFRVHSVAYFFVPILKSHDQSRFEIFCYSDTGSPDELTDHLKTMAPHWRDTHRMTDDEFCECVRNDKIDILVELTGHTSDNRMTALARKPAPIQVSYLGYPNTTGLKTMDYRLTDEWADPVGKTEPLHTETLIRLHQGFLCYQPPTNVPDSDSLPCERNGHITFGSFNTLQKINEHVIRQWADILNAVANSRLVLKAKGLTDEATRERYIQAFTALGIDASRIEVLPPTDNVLKHLEQYHRVDIALDSFPYNGTTTTCEALWMGVPIIVLEGDYHVSRVGVSIMQQAGLGELITQSAEEYRQLAVQLAGDRDALKSFRQHLRDHLRQSNLTDSSRFTLSLEDAYQAMWQHYLTPETQNQLVIENEDPITVFPHIRFDEQRLQIQQTNGHTLTAPVDDLPSSIAVLLEQQDWFQPESTILKKILKPGNQILDISADIGVFSFFVSSQVKPGGKVWALEQNPGMRNHLNHNLSSDQPTNITLINPDEIDGRLTQVLSHYQIPDANLVRFADFDQLGHSLQQDENFFHHYSPLLLVSPEDTFLQSDEKFNRLKQLGYQIYRITPALNCLTPIIFAEDSDEQVRTTLFFCKADRAKQLEQDGTLILGIDESSNLEPGPDAWTRTLSRFPYAAPYIDEWLDRAKHQPYSREYHKALSLYAEFLNPSQTISQRYASLLDAFQSLIQIIDYQPSLTRLLSAARMASDLGLRDSASELLQIIIAHLSSSDSLDLNEPFLAAMAKYDAQDPGKNLAEWCLAGAIECHEHNRTSNCLSSDTQDLERLELFTKLGFGSEFIQQRLLVLRWQQAIMNTEADADETQATATTETLEPSASAERKPEIAIIYHLARSGGTLISKCLACIEGNLLLSEVHPKLSVMEPIEQASQWFHLLSEEEKQIFLEQQPVDYLQSIQLINEKASQQNQHLILRDWSHIDFTAVPFFPEPSFQLSQTELLKEYFTVKQIATVRHPIDSFLSISRLAIMQGKLSLDQYLVGYKQFALKAREIGFVRYEDFCADPARVLRHICDVLGVSYSDNFLDLFSSYPYITGEKDGGRSGSVIKAPKPRELALDIRLAFESNPHYWESLEILGYEHPR